MLNWKATAPGTYTVRVVLDTRIPVPRASESLLEGIDPSAIPCLIAMPQRRYVSNPVKIVVE
jgi:hypothetical protein